MIVGARHALPLIARWWAQHAFYPLKTENVRDRYYVGEAVLSGQGTPCPYTSKVLYLPLFGKVRYRALPICLISGIMVLRDKRAADAKNGVPYIYHVIG